MAMTAEIQRLRLLESTLRTALAAAAVLFVLLYLAMASVRVPYPYELETCEGAVADASARILDGEPLYAPPTLEHVMINYTPLYYHAVALMGRITGGISLPTARLVSFLASLGSMALIGLFVWRETRHRLATLAAVGLFAACFEIGGGWYDLARIDSLFLLFLLGSITLLRGKPRTLRWLLAGALMAAAFFTKQTALVIALPIALGVILIDWRRGLLFTLAAFGGMAIGSWLWMQATDGWFAEYVFHIPRGRMGLWRRWDMLVAFWTSDIIRPMGIALVAMLLTLLSLLIDGGERRRFILLLFLAMGMFGGPWAARMTAGAFCNNVIPAYAMLAIFFGLTIGRAEEMLPPGIDEGARGRALTRMVLWTACLVQLAGLVFNPLKHLPTSADREAGDDFIALLRSFEGDVFIPYHGHLSSMAGKRTFAHLNALSDYLLMGSEPDRTRLEDELRRAIEEQRFSAIILDTGFGESDLGLDVSASDYLDLIREHYQLRDPVFDNPNVFYTRTCEVSRPETICVPRHKTP
ncbi:glycosyltransferase family 39 protein [Candidatus Sumerlaeota bacterium]|nr:glycosyltransferase family 39 protein [Candidatus Sumerlaeota bacterium]